MSDLRRLYLLQALRALVYGFASVTLGASLAGAGVPAWQVSLLFAAILVGSALSTIFLARRSDVLGRRRVYLLLLAMMGAAGTVFALTDNIWILLLPALTGAVSVEVIESGPFTSVEQAMIPQVAGTATTRAFGRYNAIASVLGALGAFAAGGPAALRHLTGLHPASRTWFLVYPLVAVISVLIARHLSESVEAPRHARTARVPLTGETRRNVHALAGLFAIDSFAGGFLVQSFIVYWFARRYGASASYMGVILAITGLIQGVSFLVATKLARRVGLLNTMVFTHLPSNIMLLALPLAPNLWVATLIFLLRFPLSQMDVPTRQGFIAALAAPDERSEAASVTNAARTIVRPVGAQLAGLAAGVTGASGLGFVISGTLKAGYDVLLYFRFRHVPIDDPQVLPPAREDPEE